MLTPLKVFLTAAFLLPTIPASAGSIAYSVTLFQRFGVLDLDSGAFSPIGPQTPEGSVGLAARADGSLLTLAFSGNLYAINPSTGVSTQVGATGLGDCTTPASPCGPNAANAFGSAGSAYYATDFSNMLYRVNPNTGKATLIGPTGIPAVTQIPESQNANGTTNLFLENLFGENGNLYATFVTQLLSVDGSKVTAVQGPKLYRIDTTTGAATAIATTGLQITGVGSIGGVVYAVEGLQDSFSGDERVAILNLTNGSSQFGAMIDPSVGPVFGLAPVPEPGAFTLAFAGLLAIGRTVRSRERKGKGARTALMGSIDGF